LFAQIKYFVNLISHSECKAEEGTL
jgi:hypothetical protein